MKQYPSRKISIIWNACKVHETPEVEEFIKNNNKKLVKASIDGGLTLVSKKLEFVLMGQLLNNARINIKVPLPDMIKIVEDAVK